MKIKLSQEQIQEILNNPEKATKAKISIDDPWWVIVLKAIIYIAGLLLAGMGTTEAATMVGLI